MPENRYVIWYMPAKWMQTDKKLWNRKLRVILSECRTYFRDAAHKKMSQPMWAR